MLGKLRSFTAADISTEALRLAKEKYPQMHELVCPAEDLRHIANNSMDLYISLRTFQSTLFDRRVALHEAYRVLRNGGVVLLSVPIMFLRRDGKVAPGLIPPGSSRPSMDYARQLVGRIRDYLSILNFRSVRVHDRSPFEVFLSARR